MPGAARVTLEFVFESCWQSDTTSMFSQVKAEDTMIISERQKSIILPCHSAQLCAYQNDSKFNVPLSVCKEFEYKYS